MVRCIRKEVSSLPDRMWHRVTVLPNRRFRIYEPPQRADEAVVSAVMYGGTILDGFVDEEAGWFVIPSQRGWGVPLLQPDERYEDDFESNKADGTIIAEDIAEEETKLVVNDEDDWEETK